MQMCPASGPRIEKNRTILPFLDLSAKEVVYEMARFEA